MPMEVNVYYRGAANKIHQIAVSEIESHDEAIKMVTEELKSDLFARKPYLAVLLGGKP